MKYALVPILLVFAVVELVLRLVILIPLLILIAIEVAPPEAFFTPYPETLAMAMAICEVQ